MARQSPFHGATGLGTRTPDDVIGSAMTCFEDAVEPALPGHTHRPLGGVTPQAARGDPRLSFPGRWNNSTGLTSSGTW